ncbi:MAG: hypothetical protein CVV21_02655 [Candidatus Goldiibacteriota bacterium HGW-Goldbacteria-1]|jgi:hypothetical protein|nr:MAG: hypothetical protein CVV21_02655 [Candidatus Goldiibacteriota bacterium HGW-Goldbacteria-1]
MKKILRKIRQFINRPIADEMERARLAQGRIEKRQVLSSKVEKLAQAEFQVFSQHGEDGIIQYLLSKVAVENKYFIEFGVESYRESNTRFLLMNDRWQGLIIDGGCDHINYISKESFLGINHDIKAVQAIITPENVELLFKQAGAPYEPGIISVDIDYNDYFILKAIKAYKPAIFITEYNRAFGPEKQVTLPFMKGLNRYNSGIYFGASLAAINSLMKENGYVLAGSESWGVNAFFVRKDLAVNINEITPAGVFENLTASEKYGRDELAGIKDSVLLDLESNKERTIKDIYNL